MKTNKGKQVINSAQISGTQLFTGKVTPTELMMGSDTMPGNAAALTPPESPPPGDVPPTGGNEGGALCVSKACGVL